jgi:death-on-curing protein
MMRRYLSVQYVAIIHAELIRFEGEPGIRDPGALSRSLLRLLEEDFDSIAAEAAALMDGIYNNRPFVDGNKRAATAVGEMFLLENGYFIDFEPFAAVAFFMQLFDGGTFLFDNLYPWLMEHIKPLP